MTGKWLTINRGNQHSLRKIVILWLVSWRLIGHLLVGSAIRFLQGTILMADPEKMLTLGRRWDTSGGTILKSNRSSSTASPQVLMSSRASSASPRHPHDRTFKKSSTFYHRRMSLPLVQPVIGSWALT